MHPPPTHTQGYRVSCMPCITPALTHEGSSLARHHKCTQACGGGWQEARSDEASEHSSHPAAADREEHRHIERTNSPLKQLTRMNARPPPSLGRAPLPGGKQGELTGMAARGGGAPGGGGTDDVRVPRFGALRCHRRPQVSSSGAWVQHARTRTHTHTHTCGSKSAAQPPCSSCMWRQARPGKLLKSTPSSCLPPSTPGLNRPATAVSSPL